jgi:type IV secretion system protein VirB8
MNPNDFQAGKPEPNLYPEALSFEASRTNAIQKSERRAWWVVYFTLGTLFLSWAAIVLMMPLNREMPYVIRVDNSTGATDVIKVLDDDRVTYDDVMDKYWIAKFVRVREKYDWWTLQNDYKEVGTMAAPDVGREYAALFEGNEALHKIYAKRYKVSVDVLSVVPNGRGIATVRISKTMEPVERTSEDSRQNNSKKYIVTLGYVYRNPSRMGEELRLLNPLGFQVMSYRLDPELVSPQDQPPRQTIERPPPEQPQPENMGGLPE